jgi:predicted nucleic acid-binding protein
MSAERAVYLDSSAIVKLAVVEPESAALRSYLRRRRPLVTSSLARAEVGRALLPLGDAAVKRGQEALSRLELIRVGETVIADAGRLLPADVRTLDAIHLATALQLGGDLACFVTYDERQRVAARANGCRVAAPR